MKELIGKIKFITEIKKIVEEFNDYLTNGWPNLAKKNSKLFKL